MEPHPAIQPVGGRGAVRRPVQPAVRGGGGGEGAAYWLPIKPVEPAVA